MSITALAFLAIYTVGIFLTFRNPYYGILTYIFEWHNHPPYFWWGDDLPELPSFLGWSFLIAIVTLISFFMNKSKLQPLEKPYYKPAIWIAVIVVNMYLVSYAFAILPDSSSDKALEIFKMLIFFLLLVTLVRNYEDYKTMIWVLIVCVAHFGFIAMDGSNRDIGVIAPNATEENALSAHVMAVLSFFGVYFLLSKKWGKAFVFLTAPLCLNLIILANSRATMLGLVAIGIFAVILIPGKIRFVVILGLVAGTVLFFQLTEESFLERQSTETYTDGSATSRLHLWSGGMNMWKDHPMGVGGGGFPELSMDYVPEITKPKSQHNTFVAVFTDWGFVGLILYLCFQGHIFLLTAKIKRTAKRYKQYPEMQKFILETTAVQLALIGLIGAGMFHSRQYAEVVYWLSGFAIILYNIQRNELAQLQRNNFTREPETEQKAQVPKSAPTFQH